MSIGEGGESGLAFETMEGYNWPTVAQFSVFLENRVGQLLELLRSFSGTKVQIVGLSIADSADCCIVRIMLSHTEQGREILKRAELPFAENELLVAELTVGPRTLADICTALLAGRGQHPLRLPADRPPPRPGRRRHAHRQRRDSPARPSGRWASRSSARPTCGPEPGIGTVRRSVRRWPIDVTRDGGSRFSPRWASRLGSLREGGLGRRPARPAAAILAGGFDRADSGAPARRGPESVRCASVRRRPIDTNRSEKTVSRRRSPPNLDSFRRGAQRLAARFGRATCSMIATAMAGLPRGDEERRAVPDDRVPDLIIDRCGGGSHTPSAISRPR